MTTLFVGPNSPTGQPGEAARSGGHGAGVT